MNKSNLHIGEPAFFTIDNEEMTIGEFVGILRTKDGVRYQVREPSEEPTPDGFKYYLVTEQQILETRAVKHAPTHDEWTMSHMAEINKAFGEDVSHSCLIILYDSLEQAKDEFGEYALDEHICRKVLDKWVFLAC